MNEEALISEMLSRKKEQRFPAFKKDDDGLMFQDPLANGQLDQRGSCCDYIRQ